MGETLARSAAPELLHYRAWRGELRAPFLAVWPIARVALATILRRPLFWGVFGCGLFHFLLFFFGQYLLAWAETQTVEPDTRVGAFSQTNPKVLIRILRGILKLDGGGDSYRNFLNSQGYIVMVALALAGATLIGNDFRFGSLPFYFSKPLSRWHYVCGKGLAIALMISFLTTIPAVVLFVQYGLLDSVDYYWTAGPLLLGVLGYGLVQTVSLTVLLIATATWLRKTVPLVMTWITLFVFCRVLANALVGGLALSPTWRLIDLWDDTWVVGSALMRMDTGPGHPAWPMAALVLIGVDGLCSIYLALRIRAVEVVR